MKTFFCLSLCVLLTACATPDYGYYPDFVDISKPPLNKVVTAHIGEPILQQGRFHEHKIIKVIDKTDIGVSYDIYPGIYLKQGEDKKTETYYPEASQEGGKVTKLLIADPWRAIMVYKNSNRLCIITTFNTRTCKDEVNFQRTSKPVLTKNSFQQTLIYSGRIGNRINIGYREYSSQLARQAFNNDVEYDLTASNVIGYKKARIQILEANNQYLKYRVLRNFNDSKL